MMIRLYPKHVFQIQKCVHFSQMFRYHLEPFNDSRLQRYTINLITQELRREGGTPGRLDPKVQTVTLLYIQFLTEKVTLSSGLPQKMVPRSHTYS